MRYGDLLELIWQGGLRPAEGPGAARMTRLLRALLPVRTICLTAAAGIDRTRVLTEDSELMPALPLGDVLAEELGLEVPYGVLVVIDDEGQLPSGADDAEMSYHLGHVVGEALLCLMRGGAFALNRETDALYLMACSYARMVAGSAFRHLGLVPDSFRSGLAAVLGAYWSGARSSRVETSGLFVSPDFLESAATRRFLTSVDAGFTAPDPARGTAGLMLFTGAPIGFDRWCAEAERVVGAALEGQGKLSRKVRIS